jgi:syntaxin-binding protein 1
MSIQESVRHKLLDVMLGSLRADDNTWRVLLVDKQSMKIISACCRLFNVMEKGVAVVEDVMINRQYLPNLEAIYFLTPTEDSVNALIRDFDPSVKKKTMYSDVHVFFTSRLPDALSQKIKQARVSSKIRTLKELNVDFLAPESSVFHLGMEESFSALFGGRGDAQDVHRTIANKLGAVFSTLGEMPYIRYARSPVATTLAAATYDVLAEQNDLKKGKDRPTLFILDRTIDTLAPILHEFTYQAMIYDLCDVQNECTYKYTYNNGAKAITKDVLLDEYDFLWPKLRHMHIADCISKVIEDFNAFLKSNKAVSLKSASSKKGVASLREMTAAMKELPQFQDTFAKYSLHIRLAGECMDKYRGQDLEKIATAEQDLATRQTAEGAKVKKDRILGCIEDILSDDSVTSDNKTRLLMIYLAAENLQPSDKTISRLLDKAKLGPEQRLMVENLALLRSTIEDTGEIQLQEWEQKKKKKIAEEVPYAVSRYVPVVKRLVESLIDDQLPTAEFPYFGDEPVGEAKEAKKKATSLKTQTRVRTAKGKEKDGNEKSGPRVIVFIVGGITHSEIRSVYQLEKREVIIGGTSILTPRKFSSLLLALSDEKKPSRDIEAAYSSNDEDSYE